MQDIQIIKTADAANAQLDLVFSSWEAGDLNNYSIIAKSYISLDNLFWGSFSKIVNIPNKGDYLKRLRNRLVTI